MKFWFNCHDLITLLKVPHMSRLIKTMGTLLIKLKWKLLKEQIKIRNMISV